MPENEPQAESVVVESGHCCDCEKLDILAHAAVAVLSSEVKVSYVVDSAATYLQRLFDANLPPRKVVDVNTLPPINR